MKRITSADNSRYKALLKLSHSSRERRKAGLSLLDGSHLVAAYIQNYGSPEQIVVSESGLDHAEIQTVLEAAAPREPLLLKDALFKQLSTVETPTGILATVQTPRPPALPAEVAACVLLEGIQDPGNLGSMLRSAAAAGIEHVLLSSDSVHAWSPRVLRAGMGSHFMLRIYEQIDLLEFARGFRGRTIATSHRAAKSVFDADLSGNVALIFGTEGSGVSQSLLVQARDQVAIPMPGKVESLNVAAAAAIVLFERVRQLGVDGLSAVENYTSGLQTRR